MAQDWYVGIGGKARRIVKAYIGVGGKARAITAGYVGVGGKARQFWSGGKVKFKGFGPAPRRNYSAGVGLTNHAVFEGYHPREGFKDKWADAISSSLVLTNCPNFTSTNRYRMGACRAGNYALFGGGRQGSGATDDVDVYNDNLVYSTKTLSRSLGQAYGCSASNIGIIGFGFTTSNISENRDVNFFSTNLVMTEAKYPDHARYNIATASTGTYGIFAWGRESNSNEKSYFDAFNQNQVHTTGQMTDARNGTIGVGYSGQAVMTDSASYADGIKSNLTTVSIDPIYPGDSGARDVAAATNVGNYALFFGSDYTGWTEYMDIYDKNFVHTYELVNEIQHSSLSAATVGRTGIFIGRSGYGSDGIKSVIYKA